MTDYVPGELTNAPCVKCGVAASPLVEWHNPVMMVVLADGRIDPQMEHLHYSCRNCGFGWTGSTLDASEVRS